MFFRPLHTLCMHPDVKPTLVSAEDQKGVREMKKDWTVVLAVIEIILNALGIFLAGKRILDLVHSDEKETL